MAGIECRLEKRKLKDLKRQNPCRLNKPGRQFVGNIDMKEMSLASETLRTTPLMIAHHLLLTEIHKLIHQYRAEQAAAFLRHREVLLREVHHRVGNSLQIIASILALDARKVRSEEARLHLENAHRRILAMATLQQQLQGSRDGGEFELAAYLRQLCDNLTASVVGDATRIGIDIQADAGTVSSAVATNVGLIVGELVINALKHAFVADTGRILVTYRVEGSGWRLTVADNGLGRPDGNQSPTATGLGTSIVAALVQQLDGRLETSTGQNGSGTSVSIAVGLPTQPKQTEGEELWTRTGHADQPRKPRAPSSR